MEKKLEGPPLNKFKGYNDFVLKVNERLFEKDPLAVLYLDIDNLKAYNFHYGFKEGDKAIELLGEIVKDVLEDFGREKALDFYFGEDNFAILSAPLWTDPISRRIIQRFDKKILVLYSEQDQSQGFILTKDRTGEEIEIPLMTLSIGVVTNTKREINHLAQVNQVGFELLKYAKTFFGSNCVVDKRSYEEEHLLLEKAVNALRTKRILIVEDDPDILEIISTVLSSEGYNVETALDGASAINEVKKNNYHLALIDVVLPDIEGLEVLRELKLKDPLSVGIIMTGYASFEGAIKAMREGAYDFLVKPLEMEKLKITIKRGIEQQGLALHNRNLVRSLTKHTAELNRKVEEVLSLNEGLQALYIGTITTLAVTLDAKDHYTQGHSERVKKYAEAIAEEMKLPKEKIKIIKYACQLHDIGKIGIKDHILLKPGPLTEEERELIQRHPQKGADILRSLDFLRNVVPIVEYHHERYNGEGYPGNRSLEEIPLGARIIAVADSFDAMTSERPYRPPKSIGEAVEELKRCKGNQFDPEVVDIFLKVLEEENSLIGSKNKT